MDDLDEWKTRKLLIDKQLYNAGWIEKYIKREVNSVKSDFKNKDYVSRGRRIEKGKDRFIDYLLLGEDNSPLAIIEAKRYSKDPEDGRIQARTYAKDIESQLDYKIPIFLTNGRTWKYIDPKGIERKISGVFTQDNLEHRRRLFNNERDPSTIKINPRIVDRPKSILNVKKLCEHFAKGHRTALIHMATGTGKTRVAMALIDILVKANMVRNVLFIVDRIALANQADEEGFKKFFNEPSCKLHIDGFNLNKRFYSTTVQTLKGGDKEKNFEKFSPGFFDLLIFDEAHRSIYDKNNLVFQYFDAIKVGLTATPTKHESRNTYKLFGCADKDPTVEYSYDEAVHDTILVPYKAQIIETKVLSEGIDGKTLTPWLKDQIRRQEENPEGLFLFGSEFDRVFMDDKTNELIITEFMNRCYKSDEGKPCKSIFFCASQRHAKRLKQIFGALYPNLSNDVQDIISDKYRAIDEVKRFKRNSEPRIALSVGMLDTGIDIPEVCNLVFVKPVFSHIRFWQMIGRGTRNLEACKHTEWLSKREKNDFQIFDFVIGGHSNVKKHEFTETKERALPTDALTKIFLNRVALLEKGLDKEQTDIISRKIMGEVNKLNEDSFIVRPRLKAIHRVKKHPFDLEKYIQELRGDIAPLIMLNQGGSPNVTSFILRAEKLFGYILEENSDQIQEIREYVDERVKNVLSKTNLTEVKEKESQLLKVLQDKFWDDLTFEDVQLVILDIAPLMKYYKKGPTRIIQIDEPDLILLVEEFEKEVKDDPRFAEFVKNNPIVQKIKDGEGINSKELLKLEEELCILNPVITIDNIQRIQKKDFIVFLYEIIGLSYKEEPKDLIEKEFDRLIIEEWQYNSKQMEFLRFLKKVFADRKRIELADFAKPPLSNDNPLDIFQPSDLENIVTKLNEMKII